MRAWLALLFVSALAAAPALGITLGQVDDFQDGTTQGWTGAGAVGGSPPTNVASGGPGGVGDRYLQLTASNFHLGARNSVQWSGNYLAEGVGEVVFDLNNFGPDAVALRVSVFGPGGTFTTTNETMLASGSGWVSASFGLNEAELTRTAGTGTLDQTLAAVTNILIRHDPDPISPPGEANLVTATLGIDNVTALPEPRLPLLLPAALAVLAASPRARRARPRAAGPRDPARSSGQRSRLRAGPAWGVVRGRHRPLGSGRAALGLSLWLVAAPVAAA